MHSASKQKWEANQIAGKLHKRPVRNLVPNCHFSNKRIKIVVIVDKA